MVFKLYFLVLNPNYHMFYFVNSCMYIQSVIKKKYGQDATNVGDEGGFAPNIQVC